jgi:hypothetical protein
MIEAVKRTLWTPLAQPEEVARAIRKAIEKNLSEVFVPKIMHLTVGIMPNLLPNAWRALSKWTKASQGWLTARKELVVEVFAGYWPEFKWRTETTKIRNAALNIKNTASSALFRLAAAKI